MIDEKADLTCRERDFYSLSLLYMSNAQYLAQTLSEREQHNDRVSRE